VGTRRTILDPAPGGPVERTSDHFGVHPVVAIAALWVAAYVVVAAIMVCLGVLLVDVLLDAGVGSWDDHISRWLADNRTHFLNDLTRYATYLANTESVVAIAFGAVVLLFLWRRWREAFFLVAGLTLELLVFLTANYITDRPRPDVPRLNSTPSTSSFPSGHAAASLVLWVGIALIVTVLTTSVFWRVLACVVAVALPATTAFARVYRGLHHLTDVFAGLVLGALVLCAATFLARVWTAQGERRHDETHREDQPLEPVATR
jgi:undecaprenyl-diphosphatase